MKYALVIEDEVSIRLLAARWLERAGYEVRAAASAADGLSLAESEMPSLLLCDIGLPDHDGAWLVRRVRELDPKLPVVIMTGYVDRREHGDVEYLTKPFGRDALEAAIERAVKSVGDPPEPPAYGRDRRELPVCPSCRRSTTKRLPSTDDGQLRWFKCESCGHIWKKGPRKNPA